VNAARVNVLFEPRLRGCQTKRTATTFLNATLLGISFLCGCEMKVTREVEARVLELHGSSSVSNIARLTTRPLQPDSRWKPGERLRTDEGATVDLSLLPGGLMHVEAGSELFLRSLSITKDGNAVTEAVQRRFRIEVVSGTILLLVQFQPGAGDCVVQTPHGLLSIRQSALCHLEVEEKKLRLITIRGALDFTPSGSANFTRLEAGYFEEWPAPGSGARASELDSRAQEIIEKSLGVERKLLILQARRRLTPFQWRQL